MVKAKISEIFESIQGEGLYQGVPQLFVRFYGCSLGCDFCDTPQKSFREFSKEELVTEIFSRKGYFHSVALTGGEPLEQVAFLQDFLPELKKRGKLVFLETNGLLYDSLRMIIDYVDIISMDFKLPSSTRGKAFWNEHRRFLNLAIEKEVYVKAVIDSRTVDTDVDASVKLIEEVGKSIPFCLQINSDASDNDSYFKLANYWELAQSRLNNVILGVQMHKMYGYQ